MDRVDEYMAQVFALETAEFKRLVTLGRARGWIRVGKPAKQGGKLCPAPKKNAPQGKRRVVARR